MNNMMEALPDVEQFLTFRLGGEEFGVRIQQVQGIQGWDKVTQIPETPKHVLGVIDLRGTVVPIIDLRRRLGFRNCEFNAMTVVIVVRVTSDETGAEQKFGLVVDAVSEVRDVPSADRKASPDFGGGVKAEYILGLATQDEQMVILLDLDRLMNDSDYSIDDEDDDEPLEEAGVDELLTSEGEPIEIDADAIEQSFALVAPRAEEVVTRFYEKLFEAYPAVRPMFAEADMSEQRRKLIGAIKLVVENVRRPDELDEALAALGARHEAVGAEASHYDAVATTMLETLAEIADSAWTPEIEKAWTGALTLVASKMLRAYGKTGEAAQ